MLPPFVGIRKPPNGFSHFYWTAAHGDTERTFPMPFFPLGQQLDVGPCDPHSFDRSTWIKCQRVANHHCQFNTENSRTGLATAKASKAIRGGIPICFPQFGNMGSLEQHGFARNKMWALDSCPSPSPAKNQSSVDLILKSTDEDQKTWPRSFELRLRVILAPGKLILIPRVRNTDSKAFSFTFAMRNYLSVSDVSEVRVEGLETLDYFDNLMQRERFTEQADAITFDGEIDRVYLSTPAKIAIIDHEKKRTLVLRKESLPDCAVWNPWDKKSKALADFGDEDYKIMLCVDSAAVEAPVVLKPSGEWVGHQELSTVSSSYYSGQLDPRKVLLG